MYHGCALRAIGRPGAPADGYRNLALVQFRFQALVCLQKEQPKLNSKLLAPICIESYFPGVPMTGTSLSQPSNFSCFPIASAYIDAPSRFGCPIAASRQSAIRFFLALS